SEFYSAAAGYFRRRLRPNRTYGLFFIFLGIFSLVLCVPLWREHRLLTLGLAFGYLFCGAVGLPVVYHAFASLRKLSGNDKSEAGSIRLDRLREVAINNRSDPVAALVLKLTDER